MAKARLLIIDDDEQLGQRLMRYLHQFDYAADAVSHPRDGLSRLASSAYDLIILDVMMPEMDGFEVLKALRQNRSLPVIMLTARGDVSDRIVGLELGADDYLPKPFEPRELVARIQTVLRRARSETVKNRRRFGDLEIDLASQRVTLAGQEIVLTHLEFELLRVLSQRPHHVLDRDALMDSLRGMDWDAFNRSIDVAVSRLRQKLGDDPKTPRFIKTVWGSGYMFLGGADV